MSGGLRIPLIVNFRSDRNTSSPSLGSGWLLALLESHIYQTNERNFVMVQPDGPNRYFYRLNPQDSVLKDRGGWAAEIKGDTITAWAECGWKLTFQKGRLVSMLTPDSRKLDFIQAGNRVVEVSEGGKVHLKAVVDSSSGLITGLEFNNRRIGIELESRPIVQNVNGQNLVASMVPSLRRLTGIPSGPKEYSYALDGKLQPTLKIAGKPDRILTWNPATKLITSDSGWSYTIKPGKDISANAAIRRVNQSGATESWYYDRARGMETEQGLDGVKRVTTYFTSGVLAGKLRRIAETAGGATRIARELSYNEKGELVRETSPDGTAIGYTYNDNGLLSEITRDGKPFARRKYDDKHRVTEEEVFGADKTSFHYNNDGGYVKTTTPTLGVKSVETFDKLQNLIGAKYIDGRELGGRDAGRAILPETSEKRSTLVKELSRNLNQLSDPVARGELLIRIGGVYLEEELGPVDAPSAIKVFESILNEPSADNCLRAKAHMWISSACLNMGKSERGTARNHLEALLALRPEGLTADRATLFEKVRNAAFRRLLALIETSQPAEDEKNWGDALARFGATDDFKQQLNYIRTEQKRKLATSYFNNIPK